MIQGGVCVPETHAGQGREIAHLVQPPYLI
jgi:hypothetical protein